MHEKSRGTTVSDTPNANAITEDRLEDNLIKDT